MVKPRFLVLAVIILAAAFSRLIPHPPDFTPIGAIALFGGAYFSNKYLAFFIPLVSMFLSDLVIMNLYVKGSYDSIVMLSVYGSFMLIVCIGLWLSKRRRASTIAGATLVSSFLFFIITNFAVWAAGHGGLGYPKTLSGFVSCYVAAIPFFGNTLLGNVFYTAVLFGGFALMERKISCLRDYNGAIGLNVKVVGGNL